MKSAVPLLLFLIPLLLLGSCTGEDTLFQLQKPGRTGVTFSNRITESEQYNILSFEYIYNGGGIAIADFNNDSLQDLFFSGNMVDNHMYLNLGNWKYRNITEEAGVAGAGTWSSGVAVVDINNDGWLDIYVCATTYEPGQKRANQLFVNQGAENGASPVFREMAQEYGIADTSYTTSDDQGIRIYIYRNRF